MCSLHCIVLSDIVHHSFSPSLIFFPMHCYLHYYMHGCILCTVRVCVRASFVLICTAQPSMNNALHITLDYNFFFPLQPFFNVLPESKFCFPLLHVSLSLSIVFAFDILISIDLLRLLPNFPISNYFHPPLQFKIPIAAPF